MEDSLSAGEVEEFAVVFADQISAGQLLESAGLSRDRHPTWLAGNARQFWSEVSHLLAAGILLRGRAQLFAEARKLFPANRIFVSGEEDVQSGYLGSQYLSPDSSSFARDLKELHDVREYIHPNDYREVQRQILHARFKFLDLRADEYGEGGMGE